MPGGMGGMPDMGAMGGMGGDGGFSGLGTSFLLLNPTILRIYLSIEHPISTRPEPSY